MEENIKRLRIFAGPNGSGKTTLINLIKKLIYEKKTRMKLGIILNADIIQEYLSARPLLHLEDYKITASNEEFLLHLNIRQRYERSINLLSAAINVADKSYIFDNSSFLNLIATTVRSKVSLSSTILPVWFEKSVMKKNRNKYF